MLDGRPSNPLFSSAEIGPFLRGLTKSPLPAIPYVSSRFDLLEPYWRPHPGQVRFLEAEARFKVLACGRRWGKTDACAAQVVLAMLERDSSRQLIVAPTLDQARLLFDRVLELLDALRLGEAATIRRSPYPHLRLGGHRLMARSGHLGRALRGNEATDIVIDEAAFLPESIITEIAMPMLATTAGSLALVSTPNGHNHFWRFFSLGERGEHGVWSARAPSSESPYLSPGFLEVQRELISERAFRVEYEAEFLDSAGRVFSTEAIDRCLVASFTEPAEPPFSIGIDWGRYRDYTAIAVLAGSRKACRLVELIRMSDVPWQDQIARVVAIVGRFPGATITCDGTGVGDVATGLLREALPRHRLESLVFTSRTKASLVDGLAWLFEQGAIAMRPDPELMRELQHFECRIGSSGSPRFEAASGFHDDLVVALALAARGLPTPYTAGIALSGARRFSTLD